MELRKTLDFLITYFFHTAFAAAYLYINTQIIVGGKINIHLSAVIFLATFTVYNYSNRNSNTKFRFYFSICALALIVGFIIADLQLFYSNIYNFLFAIILVAVYVLPINSIKLRNINYLKIVLLSSAWSVVSIMGHNFQSTATELAFAMNFLFVFSISLPFDIRDVNSDSIKTLPHLLGINISIFVSVILFILSTFIKYKLHCNIIVLIPMLIVGIPYLTLTKYYSGNRFFLAGLELLILFESILLVV